MTIIPERKKGRRGRPRTKIYIKTADFLNEFEELKREYLRRKHIVKTLYRAVFKKIEPYGTGKYRNEVEVVKAKFEGEFFKCPICGALCPGKEFVIDEKHDPPRIRVPLECGHWLDLFLKPKGRCPECDSKLAFDDEGFIVCPKCGWSEL